MSLRLRINLLVSILMIIFIGSTAILQIQDIRKQIREEMAAGTKVTVKLLSIFLSNTQISALGKNRETDLVLFLKNLGRVRAHEIILRNGIGDILYVSPPSKYKAGRYAPEWFSNFVTPKIAPFTIPAKGLSLQILPDPSRAILDAWDEVIDLVILAIAFFFILNLWSFWIISRAFSPIKSLVEGLELMTKGNLQTRLPNYPIAEFHAVTKRFNQMATALELGIKENNRLALSINQSSDALFLTNTDGMINFWNPAAEKLFEYQGEGFRNQNIRLISPNNLIHEIDTNLENILNLEHRDAFETLRKTRSGRKIEVSEKVTPIVEPETNSILGTLFVIRDLSEKRAAEKTKLELEKNRELTTVVQKRLEEERKALAMELHDELGQYVTAIKTIATSIANRSKDGDKKVYSSSTAIVSAAGQIYDAVHNIIRRLRPITLERFGLIETLKETIDELQKIHEEINFTFSAKKINLNKESEISLFRVAQECLNNAIKHSKAKNVSIDINLTKETLVPFLKPITILTISDDGIGISNNRLNIPDRFGLKGIRERIQNLGGTLVIETNRNRGTKIVASIPSL
ncbi:MAG: hypothetical protein CBC42_06805 [Betaproteobacteria bacterium TMED82]|nr:MAG: hypothetical protein CBC42_06805 [Betaproteobacteria bacterium TMED82]